jgi:hypothetical protein
MPSFLYTVIFLLLKQIMDGSLSSGKEDAKDWVGTEIQEVFCWVWRISEAQMLNDSSALSA